MPETKPPQPSKAAPWMMEDDEPANAAEWLKEAAQHVGALRNANADALAKVLVALFEALSAKGK